MLDLPIDTQAVTFVCMGEATALSDWENKEEPKLTADGSQVYGVRVLITHKSESDIKVIKTVTLPSDLVVGEALRCIDFIARPWKGDEKGKGGTSFWARRIEPVNPAAKQRASS